MLYEEGIISVTSSHQYKRTRPENLGAATSHATTELLNLLPKIKETLKTQPVQSIPSFTLRTTEPGDFPMSLGIYTSPQNTLAHNFCHVAQMLFVTYYDTSGLFCGVSH